MTQTRTVGEVMTPNPISITESASLAEAAGILDSKKITGLPVVDENGCLVGMISQTDLVRARANQHLVSNWPGLAVGQVMTRPALTIDSGVSIEEAAKQMDHRRVHRLVVVDAADLGMMAGDFRIVKLQRVRRVPPETNVRLGQLETIALIGSADDEQRRHGPNSPHGCHWPITLRFYESAGHNGRASARIPRPAEGRAARASCPEALDGADIAALTRLFPSVLGQAKIPGPPVKSLGYHPDPARSDRDGDAAPTPVPPAFGRPPESARRGAARRFAAPRGFLPTDRRSAHCIGRPRLHPPWHMSAGLPCPERGCEDSVAHNLCQSQKVPRAQ